MKKLVTQRRLNVRVRNIYIIISEILNLPVDLVSNSDDCP